MNMRLPYYFDYHQPPIEVEVVAILPERYVNHYLIRLPDAFLQGLSMQERWDVRVGCRIVNWQRLGESQRLNQVKLAQLTPELEKAFASLIKHRAHAT